MGPRSLTGAAQYARVILAVALATPGLMACSAQDPTKREGPYSSEFVLARQQASSDFEQAVLADSQISRSEYDEAVHRLVECARARGVTLTAYDAGGVYNYSYSSPVGDRVMSECSIGTTILIERLYNDIRMNPNHEDIYEVQAACLRREELAPASFTGKEFERALSGGAFSRPALPFKLDDEAVIRCMNDPMSG